MRSPRFQAVVALGLIAGCGGQSSIKPAELLDDRTGMTVGALAQPIELVQRVQTADAAPKRPSFAYLGPVEWDRMGDISYALWVHVAPGNDRQIGDIRSPSMVALDLDDGPLVLSPIDGPTLGGAPYQPVVSWGQTQYFELNAAMLKRMAASGKLQLEFRAVDASTVIFEASHETRTTLERFTRARGITDD